MSREAGKGSKQRPLSVSINQFENNWDKIFGKKDTKTQEKTVDKKNKTKYNKKIN